MVMDQNFLLSFRQYNSTPVSSGKYFTKHIITDLICVVWRL